MLIPRIIPTEDLNKHMHYVYWPEIYLGRRGIYDGYVE